MATTTLTAAQVDLINSLTQDEIPTKLRCAICSKLAVNAFRSPCCDQAICESCQSSLPSPCPVCEHSPVAAEDCKPNKSLRTTIRVYLRTEEKKREALRLKDLKNASPNTPITPTTPVETPTASAPPLPPNTNHEDRYGQGEVTVSSALADASSEELATVIEASQEQLPAEVQQDIPQPSIEEIIPGQEPTEEGTGSAMNDEGFDGEKMNGNSGMEAAVEKDAEVQSSGIPGAQGMGFGMGFGFDPTAAAGFPNMGLMGQGGDFNQMQMMMAMQNGIAPNAFSAFPMMGMPAMTMDPMAMQNLYMNGGFGAQGMGMNGMNMGMGMAGFDGGLGTGFNNGWNGQQSWNIGQDNFNHTNAAGMGHGDYSSNNTGFQNAAGYNQGNYGRTNQYNNYQQNGYGQHNFSRGRGRGRGYGYGSNRGGYGYGHQDGPSQQLPAAMVQESSGPMNENGSIPNGPKADIASSVPPASNVDKFGREIRPNMEAKASDDTAESATDDKENKETTDTQVEAVTEPDISQDKDAQETLTQEGDSAPKPIQTLEQLESLPITSSHAAPLNGVTSPSTPLSPSGSFRGQGAVRGAFHGGYNDRGALRSMQPPKIPTVTPKVLDVPINAPTGPKAMREGLPNTSLVNLRGRGGFASVGRGGARLGVSNTEPSSNSERPRNESPIRENEEEDRGRSRSPSMGREWDPEVDRRGEKRRRHRHRSTSDSEEDGDERRSSKHRRRHRRRSASMSEDGKEEESRRERRRRRERKHNDEADDSNKNNDLDDGESRRNSDEVERSRSQSPAESRRSAHRSRRDRDRDYDRDRERDRDRDREHKSTSHKYRSSHRSHRDRTRSRSASHDRDRSHERERRHRRRHESVELEERRNDKALPPPVENDDRKSDIAIPAGPRAMTAAVAVNGTNGKGMGIEIKGASARRKSIQGVEERRNGKERDRERDRNRERERERERGRDRDRDRNRERDRDRDREQEREPERERERERERDKEKTRRPSIPTGPSALNSSSRSSISKSVGTTSTNKSAIDPHTIEREARNRERLLKEAQRMAGLAAASSAGSNGGGPSKKRSRDEPPVNMTEESRKRRERGGGSGRDRERGAGERREREKERDRYSQRENEEDRVARLEGEREAERWA